MNGATRNVSAAQAKAIKEIMQIFVDDDLARGIDPEESLVCDHCHQRKPAPGFISYDAYKLCNDCSYEYELARVCGLAHVPGQFMMQEESLASPAAPSRVSDHQ